MPEVLGTSKNIWNFDPTTIPGCILWIDAADSSTITGTTSVTGVREKAQGTSLTTQGTSSYLSLASNTINGRPSLYFDNSGGNNVYLSGAVSNTTIGTMCIAWKAATQPSATYRPFFTWNDGGGLNFPAFGYLNSQTVVGPYTTFVGAGSPSTSVTSGSNYITTYSWSGTTTSVGFNGATPRSGAMPGFSSTSSTVWIGWDNGIATTMYLGELLIYNSVLTTSQRQQVEGYLAWKWGMGDNTGTFVPTSISGCSLWLDGAQDTTTSGSYVRTLPDRSGSGNDLAPVSANTITLAGNTLNGKSVYNFGSGRATRSSFLWDTNFTQFVVVKGSGQWLSSAQSSSYNSYVFAGNWELLFINPVSFDDSSIAQGTSVFTSTAGGTTAWTIFCLGYAAGSTSATNYTLNGTVRTSQTGSSTTASQSSFPLWLNGNQYYATDTSQVAEFIHYNASLTTSQRQSVEGYLAWKWGVQSSLPSSHPYSPSYLIPTSHSFYYIKPFSRPFVPTDIPNCKLWLDGADTTAMTLSSGNITKWLDKSGMVNDAFQHDSSISVSSNGLYFGGSSYMSIPGLDGALASTPFVVFVVETYTGSSYNFYFGADSATGTGGGLHIGYRSQTNHTFGFYYDDLEDYSVSGTGNRRVWTHWLPDTSYRQTRRNGAVDVTHTNSNRLTSYANPVIGRVFGGNSYIGTISEIIVYTGSVTLSQIQQVEGYLAWKWGNASLLPTTHPAYKFPTATAVPFLPTNISGCFLWLDGADTSTMTLSGSNVSEWRDKSGNGYTATLDVPTAAAFTPTGLLFSSSRYYCPTGSLSNVAYTIFTVQNTRSASGGSGGYQRVLSSASETYVFVGVSNGYVATFTGNGISWNDVASNSPSVYNVDTTKIVCMQVSNTVLTPYTNGFAGIPKTGTTSLMSNFYIGDWSSPNQPWSGTISEVIIYNALLSDAQRQQVEGYLAWKWNLVSSLGVSVVPTGYSSSVGGSGWVAYTFTTTGGSIRIPNGKTITVDYFLVGGGGGASGYIGGGGGGGYYASASSVTLTTGVYTITIGAGGTGQIGTNSPTTTAGGDTKLIGNGSTIATGSGGGGAATIGGLAGSSGPYTGGSYNGSTINSGGGAGAAANGANGGTYGGNGGIGVVSTITGTSVYYGGGGGGGYYTGGTPGTGGLGGGANGASTYNPSTHNDGTNGLGGGGGGATGGGSSIGGNGGSGVAIIRIYL